ncbi:hypothetical protein LPTSP4_10570 [Leptospira ryugenii]|uniref:Uncharacterized protein n=1 Tax=Leptospira ryugenii TaxID=1917863 RepID=A0A2P2DY53_9LEPT|nr:hypothetical protein [Leptospira ryugenii]GBF49543.1 hypothetical protein LPTSP4_10570 [Leptospira ryugenii]
MILKKLYQSQQPHSVFLIDAFGASVSLTILLAILIPLQTFFGMPSEVLYHLAILAFLLFLYSSSCLLIKPKQWRAFLLVVVFGNLSYCLLSFYYLVTRWDSLTTLGELYFISEKFTILGIIVWEWKVYRSPN